MACFATGYRLRYNKVECSGPFPTRGADDLIPGLAKVIGTETIFTYTRQMDEDEPFTGEWVLNAKSYPSIFDLGGKFNPDTFTQCPGGTLQGVYCA